MTDDELVAATIGDPVVLDRSIYLAEYDPAWPALFSREAERLRSILGPVAVEIHHTGSTSVPGLAAKPIIDITMAVPDTTDEAAYVAPLEQAGYVLRIREPDWNEHRMFKGPDTDINLHVFSVGCPEIAVMVRFRDWLRTHDDDRQLYEDTKRELAARTWTFVQHYADAKSDVVAAIGARASAGQGA